MNNNQTDSKKTLLTFHGGVVFSIIPMLIFIVNAVFISYKGILSIEAMWIGALVGLMISFFFAKDKMKYCNTILEGMGDPLIIVSIACWIFAGMFATLLSGSGLVEGIVWAGTSIGLHGMGFVIMTFFAAAIFSTATGTGFGTAVAGMSLLYPAGVLLGANPLAMIGAIIGGGAFGDNIAPVSDTTIVSASSQEADISGVVKSRLKYAAAAAIITIIITLIVGRGGGSTSAIPPELIEKYTLAKGLFMLIPAATVVFLAIKGWNIIAAISTGMLAALIIGLPTGLLTLDELYFLETGGWGNSGGLLIDGVNSMVPVSILALLVMPCAKILIDGGAIDILMDKIGKLVKTPKGAEISMAAVILPLNAAIPVSVVGMLIAGPTYFKKIGEKYNISKYRRANLLDGLSCTFAYIFPWTAQVLVAQNITQDLNKQYEGLIPIIKAPQMMPWIIYCWALLAVMLFAIATGWGHESEKKTELEFKERDSITYKA